MMAIIALHPPDAHHTHLGGLVVAAPAAPPLARRPPVAGGRGAQHGRTHNIGGIMVPAMMRMRVRVRVRVMMRVMMMMRVMTRVMLRGDGRGESERQRRRKGGAARAGRGRVLDKETIVVITATAAVFHIPTIEVSTLTAAVVVRRR